MKRLLILAAASAAAAEKECQRTVDLMVVQDTSDSVNNLAAADKLIESLKETAASYRIGMASFSDKPIPMRGWGSLVNGCGGGDIDTCYKLETGLTGDSIELKKAFENTLGRSGGDLAESQYEAMMYAATDNRVQWRDGKNSYRFMLLITDDVSHVSGEAQQGIDEYNDLWGKQELAYRSAGLWINGTEPYTKENYNQLVFMRQQGDASSQNEEYKALEEIFGPTNIDLKLQPNQGLYSPNACSSQDYPSLEQLANSLNQKQIIPIVLLTPNQDTIAKRAIQICSQELSFPVDHTGYYFLDRNHNAPCLQHVYRKELAQASHSYVVSLQDNHPFDLKSFLDSLFTKEVFSNECHDDDDDDTTAEADDTTTTPPPPRPTDEPDNGGDDDCDVTDDWGQCVQPSDCVTDDWGMCVEEDETSAGTNKGAVVGASAGAAAAAAAAGLLYKKFGGTAFRTSGPELSNNVTQIDHTDSPLEREGLEEVTMDMFQ